MSNVTFEVHTKQGRTYRVVQVFVDGEPVGFVVGRSERAGGPRWWADYSENANSFPMAVTPSLVYGVPTRALAVENLLFNTKRKKQD